MSPQARIVEAANWMEEHKGLQGDQLAKEVDAQPWDPSVKALTQFPAVPANMKQNLAWTSELGDAYMNQQQDAAQAIQTMRQRAKQAGIYGDGIAEIAITLFRVKFTIQRALDDVGASNRSTNPKVVRHPRHFVCICIWSLVRVRETAGDDLAPAP